MKKIFVSMLVLCFFASPGLAADRIKSPVPSTGLKAPLIKPAPPRKSLSKGVFQDTTVTGVKTEKMLSDRQAKIIVTGQGLNKVTSAILFLNNRRVTDVTVKRDSGSSATTLKFMIQSRKAGLKNTGTARRGNYELRLRAGTKEIKALTPLAKVTGVARPAPQKTAGKGTAPAPGKRSPLAIRKKPSRPVAPGSFETRTGSPESQEGGSGQSTPEPSTPSIPDLVITSIVQNPPNPIQGQSWKFEVTIQNQGTGNAFIPNGYEYMAHNVSGSFNGIQKGSNLTLTPGQSITGIQYPGNHTPGTHPVTFKVDPENVVNESNEANNQTTGSYTVTATQGQPDLVITNVTVDPNPTIQGFGVSVTVENQGAGTVNIQGTETTLISTIGTDNILQKGILSLTPGQSRTFNCYAVRLAAGTFNWTIKVDPDNRVSESNDNNNSQNISLTIGDGT